MTAATKPAIPMIVITDEMGYYMGGADDRLKDRLRKVPGVPVVEYLVSDGQVFVFMKLVALIKSSMDERGIDLSALIASDFDSTAIELLPEAMASPKEAVEVWGIVPKPYEVVKNDLGDKVIMHRPLGAILPGTFNRQQDAWDAFATILAGDVCVDRSAVTRTSCFTYRGQRFFLRAPLSPEFLPPKPLISISVNKDARVHCSLEASRYRTGVSLITQEMHEQMRSLERAWKLDRAAVMREVQERASAAWGKTGHLRLCQLDKRSDKNLSEDEMLQVSKLRELYPELSMLSDGALHAHFHDFMDDRRSWCEPCRDDSFLHYLLGVSTKTPGLDQNCEIPVVGRWMTHALLRGHTLHEAAEFASAAVRYDREIERSSGVIAAAMRFLEEDSELPVTRTGSEVSTMADMISSCRSLNAPPIAATQSLGDFTMEAIKVVLATMSTAP